MNDHQTNAVAPVPARKRRKAPNSTNVDTVAAPTAPETESGDAEELTLARLAQGARYCQQVEQQLAQHATPELETIMKLHRMIILKLSTQADAKPELWDVLKDLMKPVLDWARLQEQQREREFAEQKYRDQVEAERKGATTTPGDDALSPETLEKIERQLRLL